MSLPLENNASYVALNHGAVNRQTIPAISRYELFKANTGWKQSSEQYRESSERSALLKAETLRIASALESHGIQTRLENGGIKAIGEVTGQIDDIESYRSISFLPLVAQRERRPILNALQYFHRHNKLGKHLRLAVITAGERIPLYSDLRGTMQKLHRDISRWAHEADRDWNIAVIYRGSEFTYDHPTRSFHPHANVLYAPRKALSSKRWAEFLSWSHKRLGAHWKDNGKLEKPQEALKYPFKPLELDKLDSLALVWLFMQTRRLKIAQPMREFKHWRVTLEYEVTTQDRVNPFTGEITKKHIKTKRDRPLKVGVINTPDGARLSLIEKAPRQPADTKDLAPDVKADAENMILCRTSPQFRFSPYAEPVTLVQNFTSEPVTYEGKQRLEEIKARQREARRFWDQNGAPAPAVALALGEAQRAALEGKARNVRPFNVHTSRSTVQRNRQKNFSFSEPPGSRTGIPPELAGHTPGSIHQTSKINKLSNPAVNRCA